MVHVYAMAFNTEYNSGLSVATIHITNAGDVEDAFIDLENLASGKILSIKMLQIKTNVYCLAYYDYTTAGVVIRTIRIAPSGMINHTSDTIWSYSTTYATTVGFLKISNDPSNDIYAVSFHTAVSSVGSYVLTVHISSQGIVTGPIKVFTMADTAAYNVMYDTSLHAARKQRWRKHGHLRLDLCVEL